MSSVERELWDVFTMYTLYSHALDPFHMSYNTLSKLCKDCGLFELDAFPGYMTEADVYVLFVREARVLCEKRRSAASAGSGQPPPVPYGLFLTLLLSIAERLFTPYCSVDAELGEVPPPTPFSPQQCLQKLLMEHIFVETEKDEARLRKRSINVQPMLRDPEVCKLYRFFKDPLKQLFDVYSQQSIDAHNQQANVLRRTGTSQIGKARLKMSGSLKHEDPTAAERTLGYDEYLQLARDMGCGALIHISMVDMGDAYLTTITPKTTAGMLDVKRMTFPQFWECLVRWAVLAQKDRDGEDFSIDEKLKGMFLEMWHHLQMNVPSAVGAHYTNPSSMGNNSKAAFLRACAALNERFVKMWSKDAYRVYLVPEEPKPKDAARILDLAIKEMRSMGDVRHATIHQYLSTNLAAAREDVIIEVSGRGDEVLGDPRITVARLNALLAARPECSKYLFAQLKSHRASAA